MNFAIGAASSCRPAAARPTLVGLFQICVFALTVVSGGGAQAASKLKVLFSFNNIEGSRSQGELLADGMGNLYGTALYGGANGDGVVFELSPPQAGQKAWTETVLHSFDDTDGALPDTNLIFDAAGNLYGTTIYGGSGREGVVFELSPPSNGRAPWTETVLFSFSGPNGIYPQGLVADGAGNLYGVAPGCSNGDGLVYQLRPPPKGQNAWTQTVLFTFQGANGASPHANLIFDRAGNLYGTAEYGGAKHADGVAYELSPPAVGQTAWTQTVLHSFLRTEGVNPTARLLLDEAGNLYGTTSAGGPYKDGMVFELSPPPKGETAWAETVLLTFDGANGAGANPDPAGPSGGLIADSAGNLFGVTSGGGAHGKGEIFELRRPQGGHKPWTEKVLYSFNGKRGSNPTASLIANGEGNLLGTTYWGGEKNDAGVVFEHTP
jgi:uncharacterized repeat protein (TIGR03803 family)